MADTPDARPLGERLLAAGIPVVVVKPCPGPGRCPDAEKHTEHFPAWGRVHSAEECDLSAYRPGVDALALIGGHGIDLVDEDTKDGGSVDNLPPFKHFGVTRTPTGGRHFVVPSNGLGKISPLTTSQGRVGDYVGGRADGSGRLLGFLPGSVRSKPEHEGRAYVEEEAWDIDGCLAATPDVDLLLALTASGGSKERRERYVDDSPQRDPALGLHPYARTAIEDELQRLRDLPHPWAKGGSYWDPTTFAVACNLVEFANSGWSGYTLEQAEADLFDNAPMDEAWGAKQHREKWDNALATVEDGGRREPPKQERPTAVEEFGPVEDDEPVGGWAPLDLTATVAGLLDGTIDRPEPTIGCFGGGCLFYAGRINSVHGDSTGGKTWTALVTAKQEMERGETVVYVDLEDTAAGVVSRLLLDLGAAPEVVAERFVYLHPDEPLTPAAAKGLAALLDARRPSLVVVDSTGEALAIEGANPNADEEVARWFRLLPRLAVRCGAAVLLLDHATKAGDNDLWPIGSQRKRAAVTGAAYLQKVATPFGKDQDGKAVLICAKDRHGNYPLRRRVAALTVRGGAITLEPEHSTSAAGDFRPTGLMERVSLLLEAADGPLTGRNVTDAVTGKKGAVTAALDALVREGHVRREPGPRGSHLHTSVRPYREADQGDELL